MFEGEVIPIPIKLEYSKDCLRHQNQVNHDFNERKMVYPFQMTPCGRKMVIDTLLVCQDKSE